MRLWTKRLTVVGFIFMAVSLCIFHPLYTWQFLHPYYREKSGVLGVVYIVAGLLNLFVATPYFAGIFCGLVITVAVQAMVVMNLASTLKVLDVEEQSLAGHIVTCSDSQIVRFQIAYVEAWKSYSTICGKLSVSYYMLAWGVFMANYVGQLCYTARALFGYPHPQAGRELPWYLLLRTLFPALGDALVLMPFVSTYFMRKVQAWVGHLLFTKPSMQVATVTFVKQFNVDFPLGPVRASPELLPFCLALVASRNVFWLCEFHSLIAS
jgi:hypothetical protein